MWEHRDLDLSRPLVCTNWYYVCIIPPTLHSWFPSLPPSLPPSSPFLLPLHSLPPLPPSSPITPSLHSLPPTSSLILPSMGPYCFFSPPPPLPPPPPPPHQASTQLHRHIFYLLCVCLNELLHDSSEVIILRLPYHHQQL